LVLINANDFNRRDFILPTYHSYLPLLIAYRLDGGGSLVHVSTLSETARFPIEDRRHDATPVLTVDVLGVAEWMR
jgi:hypothetical protein